MMHDILILRIESKTLDALIDTLNQVNPNVVYEAHRTKSDVEIWSTVHTPWRSRRRWFGLRGPAKTEFPSFETMAETEDSE